MHSSEKGLETHATASEKDAEVAQKLHDDAHTAPAPAALKPVVQPSDEEIRKLLQNPQEFNRLYIKYFGDLCVQNDVRDKYLTKDSVEHAIENPKTGAEERLVGAATVAAFPHLAHALGGRSIFFANGDWCLDINTGLDYANYMGGETKAQVMKQLQRVDETHTFGEWMDDPTNGFLKMTPLIGAGTALLTGSEIYGAALALGAAPAVGLAVVGGAAAAVGITAVEYGINKASDYLRASSKYEATLKELKQIPQSASLPLYERNVP